MKSQFLGAWQLVSCNQVNADGTIIYPWGEDLFGYIIYTPEGIMAVQFMRLHRENFHSDDLLAANEKESATIPKDYNCYFGTYEIDSEKEVVIHHIQGHLVPNMVGKDNVRHYRFENDLMFLSTVGGNVERNLVWRKMKG